MLYPSELHQNILFPQIVGFDSLKLTGLKIIFTSVYLFDKVWIIRRPALFKTDL